MEFYVDIKKKVLVPILTEKECELEFLDNIADKDSVSKVVLLFVVDREAYGDLPAADVGSKIKTVEEIFEKVKNYMPKGIEVVDYIEWGKWLEKIDAVSKRDGLDEVFLVEGKKHEALVNELKGRNISVNVFSFPKVIE